MIDENNFTDILVEYATGKYGEKFAEFHDKFYDEFPYKMDGLDEKTYFKNFMDWLIFEKKLPPMGKTIVEEYIDEHPDMDGSTKQKLIGTKEFITSEFIVISKKGLSLKVKDRKTGKVYNSIFRINIPGVGANSLLIGRIHSFGGIYLFAGAFGVHNSPMILDPDIMMNAYEDRMIRDAEKMVLSSYSKLTAILNKYPSQWVDGICNELSLDTQGRKNIKAQIIAEKLKKDMPVIFSSLPEKSKEVLKILLNNGGYINYGKLKDFEDDISFFWTDNPPTSTIGILRVKGLLAIGKMPLNGRMYQVALVPEDIREEIKKMV
ncbi:hypothetical protein J4457_04805 [Candidatus Woesearchaeota archaeon]|nr:hypothetical protein [Candidatus Woesearchaeota archaeon]